MSGASTFFCRSCLAKSHNNSPESTQSIFNACEFESLIPWQDQNLTTEESALATNFSLIFFHNGSIWYKSAWYLGSSCFVIDYLSKLLLLYTEARTRTSYFITKQIVSDGWSNEYSGYNLSRTPKRPFFLFKSIALEIIVEFGFKIFPLVVLYDLQICFEQILYPVAEKPDKSF